MISINNHKQAAVLVTIAVLAGSLAVSMVHNALAAETVTITKNIRVNNTGINVPTDTDQKQNCQTAGANSGIGGSCTASSTDTITQSGGKKIDR